MGKKNAVCKKEWDEGERVLRFAWDDGTVDEVSFDALPENIKQQAAIHGLLQKLGDSYASAGGHVPTAKDKFYAVLESLQAGEWNRKRQGSGGLLAEALARIQGIDVNDVREKLATLDADTVDALKKDPRVKAAIKEIELERARERAQESNTDVDLSGLFE